MFVTIFYLDRYETRTEAVRPFGEFTDAKAAADSFHDGQDAFATVYDLNRLDPSGNATMVYHSEHGMQVADIP